MKQITLINMHKDTIIAQQTDIQQTYALQPPPKRDRARLTRGKNAIVYYKKKGGGEGGRKKESLENNYVQLILHNLIGECESTAHTTAQKVAVVYFRLARHRPASNAINTVSAVIL